MAISASVSSTGAVTVLSTWTGAELITALGADRYLAAGNSWGTLFPNLGEPGLDASLTSLEIQVYRSVDITAEGVIRGRPYFGTITGNPRLGLHGPIRTSAQTFISTNDDFYETRQLVSQNRNPDGSWNALTERVFAWSFTDTAGLFNPLSTRSSRGNPTRPLHPGGRPRAGAVRRTWSEKICNGDWVIVVRERYSKLLDTPTIIVAATVVRRVAVTVTGVPCPGSTPLEPVVTARATSDTTIQVSWVQVGTITPTHWEVSTDNATWTRVDGLSHMITGLTDNTTYTVYVRGVNAEGNGVAGQATGITTFMAQTAVLAPTVTHSNLGTNSVTIQWTAATGGTAVARWQSSRDGTTWTDVPGGAAFTNLGVTNLAPSTAYTFYIRGVSGGGAVGNPGSTSFTTRGPVIIQDLPILGEPVVQRSLIGTPGGGSLKTTDRPPAFIVRSNRPSVVWDTSPFIVSPTNIYPGATLPGTADGRAYADEFDPLPLKWSFFPAPATSAAQASVRVLLNVYNAAGNTISAGQRTLQLVNNVASFTSTATRVASELTQFDVAGNTAGTQAASQGAPNGWGATPDGDSVGFARIGLQLSATDAGSPAATTAGALFEFVPYQGLRLGDISTYNAGAGLVGFECHYYAKGITATTQARNNEVAYYKWAIYRRNAPENERPVAGTIREAGQTLTASGAHWVPTNWSMGYRLHAWQNPRGQVALINTGLRNPDTTRLRIAFPSAETTGLLPNGNYTVRLRVIDIYGNQVGPQSFNFSVNRAGGTTTPVSTTLPPGSDAQTIAVVPVPRVYTADGTLTTTANTGLADVTTGLIPGQSIGLSVNVVGTVPSRDDLRDVVGSEGEVVNILVIQRREFSRVSGGDVDRSPRIVSGRIFINTIGGSAGAFFPTFRVLNDDGGVDAIFFDHQLESGVEYQYRCVWINKFSNRSYSTWVPA